MEVMRAMDPDARYVFYTGDMAAHHLCTGKEGRAISGVVGESLVMTGGCGLRGWDSTRGLHITTDRKIN